MVLQAIHEATFIVDPKAGFCLRQLAKTPVAWDQTKGADITGNFPKRSNRRGHSILAPAWWAILAFRRWNDVLACREQENLDATAQELWRYLPSRRDIALNGRCSAISARERRRIVTRMKKLASRYRSF
jgi:hypothetical protein